MWHEGYNLLLYGCGSKRQVVEEFLAYAGKRGVRTIAVLDGSKPSANLRSLLESVCRFMLKCNLKSGSVVEQVRLRPVLCSVVCRPDS
jgi:hypothetical protein